MSQLEANLIFCPLPDQGSRLGSFATSFSVQSAAVVLLGIITLTAPPVRKQFEHVELTAPAPARVAKQQPKIVPAIVKPAPKQISPVAVALPRISIPPPPAIPKQEVAVRPVPQPPAVVLSRFDPKEKPAEPRRVDRAVQTNVFGSSATATLPKMAPSKVQTGGFGDPNGVAVAANGKGKANIAAVGSFDLPSGPGYGNGTGGSRGVQGVIASTGFGNGVAAPARPATPQVRVQATKFDAVAAEPKKAAAQPQKAAALPVAIQEKPTPVYTAEARRLHVEGEVLLQVMFTASGQVHVLRVVNGLGHGLDEAAIRAAERIRFAPALREGRPVDSTATLHILFQLS